MNKHQKKKHNQKKKKKKIKPVGPQGPPPMLKRTVSVKPQPVKKTMIKEQPVKQTIKKKQFAPEPVTIEPVPTITNIYGREHRNERVKQKATKMNTLFVNAI